LTSKNFLAHLGGSERTKVLKHQSRKYTLRLFINLLGLGIIACEPPLPYPIADFEPNERYPGGKTTNVLLGGGNAFIRPASNLTRENEKMFFSGNSWFNQGWVQAPASAQTRDGLGPLYNATSCSSCHPKDGRGRALSDPNEATLGLLFRLGIPGAADEQEASPEPNYGDQLQPFSLRDVPSEGKMMVVWEEQPGSYADGTPYSLRVPTYSITNLNYGPLHPDVMISPRVAPSVIGLGLLEAIPDEVILEKEDINDHDNNGISGKAALVFSVIEQGSEIGRFGWKSEQSGVREQVVSAFNGDIGITSSLLPAQTCTATQTSCSDSAAGGEPELEDHILDRLTVYTQAVAVPVRKNPDDIQILRGKFIFSNIGCDDCHTPKYTTGNMSNLEAMNNQIIWPFTDLLLHDMGPGLADGRPVNNASGSEWRTPPLWGLGRIPQVNKHNELLHDGRARGFAEAILWHGGEGEKSKEEFRQLASDEREALISFLRDL